MREQRGSSKQSLLISVAIHVLGIAALATITFRYPIGKLLGVPHTEPVKPEKIQFLVLPKGTPGAVGNGANPEAPPPKGAPAPLRAPDRIPVGIPPVPPSSSTGGAISGKEGGTGGAPVGIATGIEPRMPDSRIALQPGTFTPVPMTRAQAIDTLVKAIFQAYGDSIAIAEKEKGRDPTDWTVKKGNQTWGIDPKFIHLGKFSIPTAVLAVLPLKAGNGMSPVDIRSQQWIRQDIMQHAQDAITEDEFRAAVKRIRERKDKERQGQVVVEKLAPGSDGPVGAMPEHGGRPQ